jgi:hypothetical protein
MMSLLAIMLDIAATDAHQRVIHHVRSMFTLTSVLRVSRTRQVLL